MGGNERAGYGCPRGCRAEKREGARNKACGGEGRYANSRTSYSTVATQKTTFRLLAPEKGHTSAGRDLSVGFSDCRFMRIQPSLLVVA